MNAIRQKKGRWYLRKSFEGKQREIALNTDNKKTATTRANRFLTTLEEYGWDAAVKELGGKQLVKRGDSPTFEQMEEAYRDYLKSTDKPPKANTVKLNLRNLERVMQASKASTVAEIDLNAARRVLLPDSPTDAQRRSWGTILRTAKSVFKKRAVKHYEQNGLKVQNPFEDADITAPKVRPYVPMPQELRRDIYEKCTEELEGDNALIVLLALCGGLRPTEIQAARMRWFADQGEAVALTVQEEDGFKPKAGEAGTLFISKEEYDRMLTLRGEYKGKYFIPRRRGGYDLQKQFNRVVEWLKGKGVDANQPIRALRKECGSLIAKQQGIYEASRFLRHSSITVTATHYAGLLSMNPVKIS